MPGHDPMQENSFSLVFLRYLHLVWIFSVFTEGITFAPFSRGIDQNRFFLLRMRGKFLVEALFTARAVIRQLRRESIYNGEERPKIDKAHEKAAGEENQEGNLPSFKEERFADVGGIAHDGFTVVLV